MPLIELGSKKYIDIGPKQSKISGVRRKIKAGDGVVLAGYYWLAFTECNPNHVRLQLFNLNGSSRAEPASLRVGLVYQLTDMPETYLSVNPIARLNKLQIIIRSDPSIRILSEKSYIKDVLT